MTDGASRVASTGVLNKYKLVFLGDQSVGKTSIITRFMYENFDVHYQATIGIDFLSKTVFIDDRTIRLQLWDTGESPKDFIKCGEFYPAGQERFRSLIPSYIRDSSAAVVVYDITNRTSFNNTIKWIEDVRSGESQCNDIFCPSKTLGSTVATAVASHKKCGSSIDFQCLKLHSERGNDVVIALVGNKNDMEDRRQVHKEEGEQRAKELDIIFMEASAKTGENVKSLFRKLARTMPGNDAPSLRGAPLTTDIHLNSAMPQDLKEETWKCRC